jgi:RES domain-containing protein
LPADWHAPTIAPSVQMIGDAWVDEQSSVILQVPSAAVLGEYSYLFNPLHPHAKKIELGPVSPLSYDPRVLK